MLKDFLRAVAAGLMIGIGGTVFLSAEYPFVGAVFFTVGLISVLLYGMNLYTGRVGYASCLRDIVDCLISVAGNAVGCAIAALLPNAGAAAAAAKRLETPLPELFLKAAFCGVLIYIAVDVYKTRGQLVATFFCVPAFILAGFEHSVADMYYFFAAREFSGRMWLSLLVILVGNGVGAVALNLWKKFTRRGEEA